MFEKVNPSHPDKLADRIAGAMVDMAYEAEENPRIAVEVLIGHGNCYIIYESSVQLSDEEIRLCVFRITCSEDWYIGIDYTEQDEHLAENQSKEIRCGDNGIFKGAPRTMEQAKLSTLMRNMYKTWPTDGKAVINGDDLTICQSNAKSAKVAHYAGKYGIAEHIHVNPLGEWTGGPNVDTGATNRKLGSDMGDAVTGGGLHGKDLSKADVSVNIACHMLANAITREVTASCSIGDREIAFDLGWEAPLKLPYGEVVNMARRYVDGLGGFEKLAEWGLV